jgi:hypothetical protein
MIATLTCSFSLISDELILTWNANQISNHLTSLQLGDSVAWMTLRVGGVLDHDIGMWQRTLGFTRSMHGWKACLQLTVLFEYYRKRDVDELPFLVVLSCLVLSYTYPSEFGAILSRLPYKGILLSRPVTRQTLSLFLALLKLWLRQRRVLCV